MLEKHDGPNKYTWDVAKNGEIGSNNNVSKTELNGIHDNCSSSGSSELPKKTFRNALPQILATCAKNLLLLTYGMTLGITTIALPALESKEGKNLTETERILRSDTLTLTKDQLSWFSSINLICVPIGCFISGAVTQPLGRKRSMMALNLPFFTVWLLYYNATDVITLYIALIISGLAGGLHEAPVLTYVAEITEPQLRGMLGSTAPTTVIIGTVSQLILGNFYHWRTVVFFNMFFPIIAFTALCFIPESPHWLIANGRFEDAEKALCWLRGWVTPNEIQEELVQLKKSILTKHKRGESSIKNVVRGYTLRTFIIPHLLVIGTFLTGHFGGMMSVQTNAVKIFKELGSSDDEYTSTLILGVAEFAGAVLCVILVHWTGKRKLLITTTAGCAVCLFIVAAYAYLRSISSPWITDISWIPIVFLNLNAFLIHAGIRIVPWVLIGELYPTDIRATASGASALWFYVFAFGANKSFYSTLETIHLYGLLAFYGVFIALGSIFFFVFLPETEGFTLFEIEKHFARKGNIFKTLATRYGTVLGLHAFLLAVVIPLVMNIEYDDDVEREVLVENRTRLESRKERRIASDDFVFEKIFADIHQNITLSCHNIDPSIVIKWEKSGREGKEVLPNGDLFLQDLQKNDSGEYRCSIVREDKIVSKIHLNVNTPPAAPNNVTVLPSTVLALIQWSIEDDGGYPILNITVRYRELSENSSWHYVNSHVLSHIATQVDIYKLKPNSTYLFQIWATNKLGPGDITNVTSRTLHDNQEIELARHLLDGAETFDTRAWLAAVAIVMSTLMILTVGTCCILYRDWHIPLRSRQDDDPERIELIPNVILNPGYYEDVWPKHFPNGSPEEEDEFTLYFASRNGAKPIEV
ncbi:hypothetical protein V9T40_000441 [Parthenolecanium corni]|uniref:Uncharacterized protein n=1 Tax=Parthenolecanium corni TaxID=536013 RepID=A0AAN9T9J2_9HEMI